MSIFVMSTAGKHGLRAAESRFCGAREEALCGQMFFLQNRVYAVDGEKQKVQVILQKMDKVGIKNNAVGLKKRVMLGLKDRKRIKYGEKLSKYAEIMQRPLQFSIGCARI